MTVNPTKRYLTRSGRVVGIAAVSRMPTTSRWQWLTTRGYYVQACGRAAHKGESSRDLVEEVQ